MTAGERGIPPFVEVHWLSEHRDEVVLVDARWALDGSQTHEGYLAGHLPGAVYVDVTSVCAGDPGAGRAPLPDPERFAADLAALGIGDEDTVVAYDQGGAAGAARLVWMLRAVGTDAAVLDGGMAAWDGATEAGEVRRPPTHRTPVAWPDDAFVGADGVVEAVGRGGTFLVDARSSERYTGEDEPRDPRPGHIPTAVNLPLDAHLEGVRLKSEGELWGMYRELGAFEAEDVVAYCGSGMAACENLLVLESLGVRGRLFTGSWSQWSAEEGLPAARGAAAGDWSG